MAEVLDDYEFHPRGGFDPKYPHDLWLNGQIWKLVKGTDYHCSLGSIRASLYTAGKRRGLFVRTNAILEGGGLIVQAHSEDMYMPEVEFGGEG